MGKNSGVEWCDHSWNPFFGGCTPQGPECLHCYAARDMRRYGWDPSVLHVSKTRFNAPKTWKKQARVFVCSWSDFFLEFHGAQVLIRNRAWNVMRQANWHRYMIPTKRPQNIVAALPGDWGDGWPNVALGVSAGTVESFNRFWPVLESVPCRGPRWLSAEPLLEDISAELVEPMSNGMLEWLVVGCESWGPNTPGRPTELAWVERLVDMCSEWNVPLFVKQLDMGDHVLTHMPTVKGMIWAQYPEALEFKHEEKIPWTKANSRLI